MTKPDRGADPRLAATRLAAIQAIYEIDFAEIDATDSLAEFNSARWQTVDDDTSEEELAKPKPGLLRELVLGVASERDVVDQALTSAISNDREIQNIESVIRAILRVAVYELLKRPTVPARAILSTYAGLGDAFFDEGGPQVKLISGVLNRAARQLRSDEFGETSEASG